ncbi:MAG: 4Fe-4S binding protein [Caldilineaceae bacterium]|nr:4Fe-4S binding protein [Caldilineaceae bacterium]
MNSESNKSLTLTLDGQVVTFAVGETIYEVAQRYGKTIPTLCYDPRLVPFGACRICLVAVRGARNPVAACTAPAVVGMEVTTSTPEVDVYRKILLEMIVSENPRIEVDPLRSYSSQELALLVEQYDAKGGRFDGAHSGQSRHDDDNPFLLRDYDLCISCYRCVRVCAEQEGDYAISVANRGFQTQIVTEFDGLLRDSACTFCGQCVQTCPTGALADKKALRFAEI